MSKPHLTPSGVQELLDTLYALPDALLAGEAEALGTDFKGWIRHHFLLTPHQEAFLEDEVTPAFVDYVSLRVPFALLHRLPITFTVHDVPTTHGDGQRKDEKELGKIVTGKDKTSQSTGTGSSGTRGLDTGVSGSFEFEAVYFE